MMKSTISSVITLGAAALTVAGAHFANACTRVLYETGTGD